MATYVDRERRRSVQPVTASSPVAAGAPVEKRIPFVLATEEELRAYAWYVAGTVGHLLTELFERHCGSCWPERERMRELSVSFGLGLQFTNILQDLADDRRRGWSYVPEDLARRCGTSVQHLDDPAERAAALSVIGSLVRDASEYLEQAIEYTLLLPKRAPRLRLFCLWPTFFAVRTLVRIWGEEQVLTDGVRVRISRPEVRRVITLTTGLCCSNAGLRGLWKGERDRLRRRMEARPLPRSRGPAAVAAPLH
jgi:farnesyl-diphosphate farnesyltransferase